MDGCQIGHNHWMQHVPDVAFDVGSSLYRYHSQFTSMSDSSQHNDVPSTKRNNRVDVPRDVRHLYVPLNKLTSTCNAQQEPALARPMHLPP